MTETTNPIESGYALERLFANELTFTGLPVADDMPASETPLEIGWDWSVEGAGQFTVRLTLRVGPTKARPERVSVVMVAGFTRRGEPAIALLDFVRTHAPALMMPYVREAVSSLTSRGLHGALLLPPFNVLSIMHNLDVQATEGMRQLAADPALATSFGFAVAR